MRTTKVVSITMPPPLFEQAQALAKQENRTMSELVREALRRYQRERTFEKVRSHMEAVADQIGVHTEEDVVRVIRDFRRENAAPSKEPVQVKALAL
jgi:CopG family transcriptional regulator/antitoxin EndoAI